MSGLVNVRYWRGLYRVGTEKLVEASTISFKEEIIGDGCSLESSIIALSRI